MSYFRLAALGLILLPVLLLSQTPARVIVMALPGMVALEGISGTVWHGRVARASVLVDGKQFQLGQLEWSLNPISLITLSPSATFSSRRGTQRIDSRVSVYLDGSIAFSDFSASVDVGISRQFTPLYIGGILMVDVAHLRVVNQLPETIKVGRLVWQDAVWTAKSGDVPLGHYVLDFAGENGKFNGEIVTLSGPLQVEGAVDVIERDYRVDIDFHGPATDDNNLRRFLKFLAEPVTDGFDMVLEGRL